MKPKTARHEQKLGLHGQVDFNESFKLICTTRLPNPRYTPELSAMTTIVDFTVTAAGLEDQLLGKLIGKVYNSCTVLHPIAMRKYTAARPSQTFSWTCCTACARMSSILCYTFICPGHLAGALCLMAQRNSNSQNLSCWTPSAFPPACLIMGLSVCLTTWW